MTAHVPPQPEDQLADVLAALQAHVDDAQIHARQEAEVAKSDRSNRFTLLYVHAFFAILVAPLCVWHGIVTGLSGPSWSVARAIPGVPYSIGTVLFAGGVILALATAARSRAWIIAGLAAILSWYVIIALTFSGAVVLWLDAGAPLARQQVPATYAVLVYAGYAAILGIHLRTVVRAVRDLPGP